ncbi:hypothetical protein [Mycoplana ramosa]|uniref:Uncharacterized protein n=1 Tax=Mycoplana ramosa TaxID=40837 RepID=A0ABW3Z0L1_MYCRA
MLSAISNINGVTHQVATNRPQANAARTETAAAALAALSPARPLPSVSDPFDDDGFAFLYRPNGLPSDTDAPPLAAPAQATANGGSAPSRLAVESTQLSSLLSSLMSPAPTASSAAAPAATELPLPAAHETLIVKLYQQF